MNNKAIIELVFRWISRILQISEGVMHLGPKNTLLDLQNSSYPTQPHSIIDKYPEQDEEIFLGCIQALRFSEYCRNYWNSTVI